MSKIKIGGGFSLTRGGPSPMGFIQNHCDRCGWVGAKHYAHNDCRHSNCKEERVKHDCPITANRENI